MKITIEIPDHLVKYIVPEGQDPSRTVLEALALEVFRSQRLGTGGLRQLLGYDIRYQVDGFLKDHGLGNMMHYTVEDLEQDVEASRRVSERVAAERAAEREKNLAREPLAK